MAMLCLEGVKNKTYFVLVMKFFSHEIFRFLSETTEKENFIQSVTKFRQNLKVIDVQNESVDLD
jgi:hypothetical protein